MTSNTFNVRFIIKQDKRDKEGYVPIYAKIKINGTKLELSSNRKIVSTEWLTDKGTPKSSKINKELTQYLEAFRTRIYNAYAKLNASGEDLNVANFKIEYYGRKEVKKVPMLIETATEHNSQFEKLVGTKYSYGSYKNHKTTLKYLKEFVPLYYKTKDK